MNSIQENISILIVEDDSDLRVVYGEIFSRKPFHVIGEAANGQEGVDLYQSLKPDITICDIEMPIMNGLDALKAIMALNPDACVIMLTSLKVHLLWDSCLIAGATHYIRKEDSIDAIRSSVLESWREHQRARC
ncbi:MAG: response regulator [Magnetococcales bacterium]|nr:response regulator [Magnetococcales bacterium]